MRRVHNCFQPSPTRAESARHNTQCGVIMACMSHRRISRLENRLEQFVEGTFARLFKDRVQQREVALHLSRAVEDNAQPGPDGSALAPDHYTILLRPDDKSALLATEPDAANLLAETVIGIASRAKLKLNQRPVIDLVGDEDVPPHGVLIRVLHSDDQRSTQILQPVPPASAAPVSATVPQLIYQGREHFYLNRSVTNIGRKRENHIMLDDPRISRTHAQIRLRFGRCVLYDLGSKGGTFVNNARVMEAILQPGDVISLAGVLLVYTEDEPERDHTGDTQLRTAGPPAMTE